MPKLIKKGIAKDKSFIRLTFQCNNGVDTYHEDFIIKAKRDIHVGYGYCEKKPDFHIEIYGIKYACFREDGKTILRNNKCYIEE